MADTEDKEESEEEMVQPQGKKVSSPFLSLCTKSLISLQVEEEEEKEEINFSHSS
jgi:hypothetical protein